MAPSLTHTCGEVGARATHSSADMHTPHVHDAARLLMRRGQNTPLRTTKACTHNVSQETLRRRKAAIPSRYLTRCLLPETPKVPHNHSPGGVSICMYEYMHMLYVHVRCRCAPRHHRAAASITHHAIAALILILVIEHAPAVLPTRDQCRATTRARLPARASPLSRSRAHTIPPQPKLSARQSLSVGQTPPPADGNPAQAQARRRAGAPSHLAVETRSQRREQRRIPTFLCTDILCGRRRPFACTLHLQLRLLRHSTAAAMAINERQTCRPVTADWGRETTTSALHQLKSERIKPTEGQRDEQPRDADGHRPARRVSRRDVFMTFV
jgi:hypothetical protein